MKNVTEFLIVQAIWAAAFGYLGYPTWVIFLPTLFIVLLTAILVLLATAAVIADEMRK